MVAGGRGESMICWSRRGITGSPARFDPPCESVLARTSAAREALRQSRRLSCGPTARRHMGACACERLCCESSWAISRPLPGKHFLKESDFSGACHRRTATTSSSLISSLPSPPSSTALMIASSCSFVYRDDLFSFGFGWGHGDQATALCSCFLRSSSSSFFESVSN